MLGKLLKYDLKANWIYFMIMYGVLAVYSFLLRMLIGMESSDVRVQLTMVTAVGAYIFLMAAVSIMTTVLIITRFYKNMFGPEGYLTHTLPVAPSMNLASKILSGLIWNVLTMALIAGSIWVVTFGEFEQIKEILWWAVEQIYDMYNGAAFWLYSINLLLSMVSGIVIIYLVICLGQLANRHRVLCSVGYYVAYLAVNQVIRVGSSVVTGLLTRSQGDGRVEVILSQGAGIFFSIVYIVAAVLVSHYIISRKLNLE